MAAPSPTPSPQQLTSLPPPPARRLGNSRLMAEVSKQTCRESMPPVASRNTCSVCGKKTRTHPGLRLHVFSRDARRYASICCNDISFYISFYKFQTSDWNLPPARWCRARQKAFPKWKRIYRCQLCVCGTVPYFLVTERWIMIYHSCLCSVARPRSTYQGNIKQGYYCTTTPV